MKCLLENVRFLMNAVLTMEIALTSIQRKYISTNTISAIKKGYIFTVRNTLKSNWNMIQVLMVLF